MSRSRSRTAVAALAAALALGAAACGVSADESIESAGPSPEQGGGGGGTTAPESPEGPGRGSFEGTGGTVFLREAAEATSEVTSQRFTMTLDMDTPGTGGVSVDSEGAFDNETGRGRITMDMTESFANTGADESLPEGAGIMEMIVDGGTTYVKSPLYSMMGGGDEEWMRIDTEELTDTSSLGGGQAVDPAEFLRFLEAAGGEIEEVGTEEVRGVETTHLRTTLDLRKMLEEASDEERAELEEDLEGLGAGAGAFTSLPTEAWVDEDGYVRRFTMTFDFSHVADEMDGVSMVFTVELFDFNEPVDIEIPDPSVVGELDPSVLED